MRRLEGDLGTRRGYLGGASSPSNLLPVTAGSCRALDADKVSASATPNSPRPSLGRFPLPARGVTGDGVLECCGVLTSEQGSDEPSCDSVTAFPYLPSRDCRRRRGAPSGTQRTAGRLRELLQEPWCRRTPGGARRGPRRGARPEQVIRVRLALRAAPRPARRIYSRQLLPPELRGRRRTGDPRR